jgi:hypothetical protein
MSNDQLMSLYCWNEHILAGGPGWHAMPREINWLLDTQPTGTLPDEN